MTSKELIVEARKVEGRVRSTLDTTVADLVRDLANALEAATTEWEYGHEGDTLIGVHANASLEHAIEDAEHLTRYWEPHSKRFRAVRRRKAGPWLPAEGEAE